MRYYVKESVIPMRKLPQKNTEMVSQAYFSEEVELLEKKEQWGLIKTLVDQYPGWVELCHLQQRSSIFPTPPQTIIVERRAAHVYAVEDTIYGPLLTLPFESRLETPALPKDPSVRWIPVILVDGRSGYIQRGDVCFQETKKTKEELALFSRRFLDLPYTWGGRSSFGYDCSGFVQMLYRQMGVLLPRDSIDQMHSEKFSEISFSQAQIGDLIFWGQHERAITHVGMYLGNNEFIHATKAENAPYLRISPLSSSYWGENGHFSYRAARSLVS
jgi:hypothetical protein